MLFTSPTFLFLFLPLFLVGYWLCRGRFARNVFLLAGSLFFYAWGETAFVALLLGSIVANYAVGLWLARAGSRLSAAAAFISAISVNLLPLAVLKYANFFTANLNALLRMAGRPALHAPQWRLPAGISFFTFMALSYILAVHRKKMTAERDPIRLGIYISLFPVIMAGPICRYSEVAPQIGSRREGCAAFAEGVRRFTFGLAKKTLIANTLATPANAIFALPPSDLSPSAAWLGIICYSLQIFFDFSGYSDMAIGIGRMLGFEFMENFNYPYSATSVRAFWTRWHISLSTWFRDYVYLPLVYPTARRFERIRFNGLRGDFCAYAVATLTTMLLIGLWHGASWTFLIWGIYHGTLLVLERTWIGKRLGRAPRLLQHVYLMAVIIVGWVLFRSPAIGNAMTFLAALAGRSGNIPMRAARFVEPDVAIAILAGSVLSTPLIPMLGKRIKKIVEEAPNPLGGVLHGIWGLAEIAILAVLLILSISWIAAGTYTPFIYFRF